MAGVTLEHVTKNYAEGITAVEDISLDIKDKEFIVLVGPSGCGKSTTLRMIAGLEKVSDGTIKIGSRVVNDLEPKDRDVAMVFQNYALYPHVTVFENMAVSLRLRKMSEEEIKNRVEAAAEALGLIDCLDRKPNHLSGGQRQRVAIGRAIVRNPKVFLMDEPFANMDATLRNQMRSEIMKLHKQSDFTFIYVTHDQVEAMTLGDRIVVMNKGKIMQVGTPQEVFETPKNTFVAGFIGSPRMNFLNAQLIKGEDHYVVKFPDCEIELDEDRSRALEKKLTDDQDIIVGIRPEHIHIQFEESENTIPCSIDSVELMGSEMLVEAALDTDEPVTLRLPVLEMTSRERADLFEGNKIYLTFPAKALHLFDRESGTNLIYA